MQLGIFTTAKEEALGDVIQAIRTLKKKRVHYKNTTYTKVYKEDIISNDLGTWGRMQELHTLLANYFPLSIFGHQEETEDIGIIRIWTQKYTPDTYAYRGTIYKGQEFTVRGAELIGSEDLGIQERLFLHESYLELLEQGENPDKLNWLFDMEIQFLKTHTLKDLITCLLFIGGINGKDYSLE